MSAQCPSGSTSVTQSNDLLDCNCAAPTYLYTPSPYPTVCLGNQLLTFGYYGSCDTFILTYYPENKVWTIGVSQLRSVRVFTGSACSLRSCRQRQRGSSSRHRCCRFVQLARAHPTLLFHRKGPLPLLVRTTDACFKWCIGQMETP